MKRMFLVSCIPVTKDAAAFVVFPCWEMCAFQLSPGKFWIPVRVGSFKVCSLSLLLLFSSRCL